MLTNGQRLALLSAPNLACYSVCGKWLRLQAGRISTEAVNFTWCSISHDIRICIARVFRIVDVAMRQETYISRDAADTLSTMMVNGVPDGARFLEGLTGVIASAAKAKCVGLLRAREYQCRDSTRKGWQRSGQNTQCRYPVCQVFQSICREHTAVYSR